MDPQKKIRLKLIDFDKLLLYQKNVFAQVIFGLKKSSCNKKTKLEKEHFKQTLQNSKKRHSKSFGILAKLD